MKKTLLLAASLLLFAAGCASNQPSSNQTTQNPQAWFDGRLEISSPKEGDTVRQTFTITGKAQDWFEGTVPIAVFDNRGNQLYAGSFIVPDNYGKQAEFSQAISLGKQPLTKNGWIQFTDYSAKDGSVVYRKTINIQFEQVAAESTDIKLYFYSNESDFNKSCTDIKEVERTIPKTDAVATAALNELLAGPTESERSQGYSSSIPAGSKLNSLTIVKGEARADFNAITESGGGSCSMAARVAQIRQTLLQFPTVKTVKLSVDGRTEGIFQP